MDSFFNGLFYFGRLNWSCFTAEVWLLMNLLPSQRNKLAIFSACLLAYKGELSDARLISLLKVCTDEILREKLDESSIYDFLKQNKKSSKGVIKSCDVNKPWAANRLRVENISQSFKHDFSLNFELVKSCVDKKEKNKSFADDVFDLFGVNYGK